MYLCVCMRDERNPELFFSFSMCSVCLYTLASHMYSYRARTIASTFRGKSEIDRKTKAC